MALTLRPAVVSGWLPPGRALVVERDGYHYEMANDGKDVRYRVRDDKSAFEVTLKWAFGTGHSGQTYVYEHQGDLYESRVSYYPRIEGLDLTLGAANEAPSSLPEAAGRRMSAGDVRECFGCHSSHGYRDGGGFDLEAMTPGIRCAHCHSGADEHARNAALGKLTPPANPARNSSSEDILNFCGTCHRTWADVVMMGIKGVNTVRFQPYRLSLSQCYSPMDPRLNCVQCHDPHRAVESDAKAYDRACLACHRPGEQALCKVATDGCVDCHMPKTELPGAHFAFRDHYIRVHRDDQAFPD
ncbi:MAG: hypothetical protein KIT09_26990 [Bryobacteraceae bacterium]|nr:hypothetical protein [Bryobacteraceae bacterium]